MGRRQKGSQEGRLNQGAWEQVAERDNIIWEVNWVIPQRRIKNESGLKEALKTTTGNALGARVANNSDFGMEHRRNSEKLNQRSFAT